MDELIIKRYQKFLKLPLELREALFAPETVNKLDMVAGKNKLAEKQTLAASYTIGLILLGEINIANFAKALQEKCQLTEEGARQLTQDINQAIFLPIKESLKKIHRVAEWPREYKPLLSPNTSQTRTIPKPAPTRPMPPRPSQSNLGATRPMPRRPAPLPAKPKPAGPKIEGNVVNLKEETD